MNLRNKILLLLCLGAILAHCNHFDKQEAAKELDILDQEIAETERLLALQKHKANMLKLQRHLEQHIDEDDKLLQQYSLPSKSIYTTTKENEEVQRHTMKPHVNLPSPKKIFRDITKGLKHHLIKPSVRDPAIDAFNRQGSDSKQNISMNLKHILKTNHQVSAMTEFYHHFTNTEYLIVALREGLGSHFHIYNMGTGDLVTSLNLTEAYTQEGWEEYPILSFTIGEMFANIKRPTGDILLVGRTHDGRVFGWSLLPKGESFEIHYEFQLDAIAVTRIQSYPTFGKQMIITGDSFGELRFFNSTGALLHKLQTSFNHISVMSRKRSELAVGSDHVIAFIDLTTKLDQLKMSDMETGLKCVSGASAPFVETVYDINRNSFVMFALSNSGEVSMFDTRAYIRKKDKEDPKHKGPVVPECRLLHVFQAVDGPVAKLPPGVTYIPGQLPLTYNQIRVPHSDYKHADIHSSLGYLHVITPQTWSTFATGNVRKGPTLVFEKDLRNLESLSDNEIQISSPLVVHIRRDVGVVGTGRNVFIFSLPLNELWYTGIVQVLFNPMLMAAVLGLCIWKLYQSRELKRKERIAFRESKEKLAKLH